MKTEWLQAGTLFCGVVGAMSALSIQAAPPGPTLAEIVAKAELIVVGKLEPWETHRMLEYKGPGKDVRYATVNIQIREVLKGKAGQSRTLPPGASGRTYARKVTDAAQVYVSDSGDVRFRDFSDVIR